MSAVPKDDGRREDPPALQTALAMLKAGLRPVMISPGKKKPMGEGWGLKRYTEDSLRGEWARCPFAGVGIILGDDGEGGGVIDVEVDDEDLAAEAFARIFPAGPPDTLRFRSNLGMHYLLRYSGRFARYGHTRVQGKEVKGEVIGNEHYLGLELRIGTVDPASPAQMQSVVPPTSRDDGSPRQWIGPGGTLLLPETAFDDPARILAVPESVFADLDRFARPLTASAGSTTATWDADTVKAAILPTAMQLVQEWGLRVVGRRASGTGFWTCHAIGREDAEPSAGFNPDTGIYHDHGTGTSYNLFQFAVASDVFPDFPTAVNRLGERFAVPPVSPTRRAVAGAPEGAWADPAPEPWDPPVVRDHVEAMPFPLGVLPEQLRRLCTEAVAAMHCPADYFAVAALGLAGGVIGRSVALKVTSTWEVTPNLFVAIIGSPGSKKSPALKVMTKPLWAIDRILREKYKLALAEHKADNRDGDDAELPTPRQLTMDDATREAFAQVHAENPRGLVLIKDELTAWVATLNAYRQGKGDDKQFWMSLNSGAPVKVNRKGSREPLIIAHPCSVVVGCLTPGTLPSMRETRADDGWLDRILFSFPTPMTHARRWTREEISAEALDAWSDAIQYLWNRPMVVDEETGRERPYFVRMTDTAYTAWEAWYNAHNAEAAAPTFPAHLVGPWSKLEGFCLRIALVLSQLRQAYGDRGKYGADVTGDDIVDASTLVAYFKNHFRRARGELSRGVEGITEDADRVLRWILRDDLTHFNAAQVITIFRDFTEADRDEALRWLSAHRFIRPVPLPPAEPGKRGRKPLPTYEINPFLFQSA